MTLTNEDLLSISRILEVKLDSRLKPIERWIELLAHGTPPRSIGIEIMEAMETYNAYLKFSDRKDELLADIELLKKVVNEHDKILEEKVKAHGQKVGDNETNNAEIIKMY